MGASLAAMTAHSQLMTGGAMHEAMSAQLSDSYIHSTLSPAPDHAWSLSVELAAVQKNWRKAAHDALLGRHTNRLAYRRDPVQWRPAASRFNGAVHVQLIKPGRALHLIARAVEQSAQARFQCRELHEWLHDSLRWTNKNKPCAATVWTSGPWACRTPLAPCCDSSPPGRDNSD